MTYFKVINFLFKELLNKYIIYIILHCLVVVFQWHARSECLLWNRVDSTNLPLIGSEFTNSVTIPTVVYRNTSANKHIQRGQCTSGDRDVQCKETDRLAVNSRKHLKERKHPKKTDTVTNVKE